MWTVALKGVGGFLFLFLLKPCLTICFFEQKITAMKNYIEKTLNQRVARPRLEFQDQDFYNFSLNIETKTETENFKVSMSRPRLQISKLLRQRLIETLIFKVVETETHRDSEFSKLSSPRLI